MAKKSTTAEFVKWLGPILDSLRALGGSAKPSEIVNWFATEFKIPDEILNERYEKSGTFKFQNQVAWARQYLVWEDLLTSSKYGVWTLTQKGWETKLNEASSKIITTKWGKIFRDLKAKNAGDDKSSEPLKKLEKEVELEVSPEEASTDLKPTLLQILQKISPTGFEHLCGNLLRENGFENIEITKRSHDGGIDGYASLKLNPFVNISVFFQCKRYQGTVPTDHVHAFMGVMEINKKGVEKGLMITTGSFAKAALEIERSNIKLELIDGTRLVEMFERVQLGVTPTTIYEPNMSYFKTYMDMK